MSDVVAGVEVEWAMLCSVCNSQNTDNATVCRSCGSPLTALDGGPPTAVLPAGAKLDAGKFTIGKVLGQGGFGITYLGGDTSLGRSVAIKEFFPQGCVRQGMTVHPSGAIAIADYHILRQKFLDEARVLAQFRHRGIVEVYATFEANNTAYMVMEFVKGKTLQKFVDTRGPLSEKEVVGYIAQAADALKTIHDAKLLHRDIKPENLMVTQDARVVLVDFGTARAFASGKTSRMTAMLTPGYAPLEQYGQQARFGVFTDLYALGATCYHLLTGQMPVQATDRAAGVELQPPHRLNHEVSQMVSDAVMWAMEMRADRRPQSAQVFMDALTGRCIPRDVTDRTASRKGPSVTTLQSTPPRRPTSVTATVHAKRPSEPAGTPLAAYLNRSCHQLRVDYLAAFFLACPVLAAFYVHPIVGTLGTMMAIVLFLWIARWEWNRRSVSAEYTLDGSGLQAYQDVVCSLNELASCQRVWVVGASTYARIESGAPRWLKANITVSAIMANGQTLYFLPDCLLLYNSNSVAGIAYKDVNISCGTIRSMEQAPPNDAQIVDRVWLHQRVNGGPDRRYSYNPQIPICLYGEMKIESAGGLSIHLRTSRAGVADHLRSSIGSLASGAFGNNCELLRPKIEVNREHSESLLAHAHSTMSYLGKRLVGGIGWFDNLLRIVGGDGNSVIHGFLRVLSAGAVFAAIVAVVCFTINIFWH